MGWTDSHLHQFIQGDTCYGAPDREYGMPMVSERRTRLGDLLVEPGDRLIYEYDFGDAWQHSVVLEQVSEAEPGLRYPRVVAGKRACPPEDVGGSFGYAEFIEAIRNPDHEEHASMLEWAGGEFDAERFDLIAANDRLPRRRAISRNQASQSPSQ